MPCNDDSHSVNSKVESIKRLEREFGLLDSKVYDSFQKKADTIKNSFLSFLIEQRRMEKKLLLMEQQQKGIHY